MFVLPSIEEHLSDEVHVWHTGKLSQFGSNFTREHLILCAKRQPRDHALDRPHNAQDFRKIIGAHYLESLRGASRRASATRPPNVFFQSCRDSAKNRLGGDLGSIPGELFLELPGVPGKRVRAGYRLLKLSRVPRLAL